MESQPVSRRTRFQKAIKDKALSEEKKKRWFAARSNWRNRVIKDVKLEIVSDDTDDDEEESIITNIAKQNLNFENKNLGGLDKDQQDNEHDTDKQPKVDGKYNATRHRNNEDSDDSLQIIGERWNPDYCYASHSSVDNSDSDRETMGSHRGVGHSRKTNDGVSSDSVNLRFDGLVLPIEPEKKSRDNDFVGRRTRSVKKKSSGKSSVRKRGRPFKTASVSKVFEWDFEWEPDICSKPVDEKRSEIVVKKKPGRPRRNKIAEKDSSPERKMQSVETNEIETIMPNKILENETIMLNKILENETIMPNKILEDGNVGLETCVPSVSEALLPLKFSFRVPNSLPEKSEKEKETDELFSDLDFALRPCHVDCSISSSDEEDDNIISYEGVAVQAKLCRQGKHYLILEDEIGIRCKFCSFIKLEIRYVTPDFHYNPFRRSKRKELPPDGFRM